MMDALITRVIVVGGGTAGWLSACLLAARRPDLAITLVEASDIPTIGVGEGTWPTMRETLTMIGMGEAEFLRACDASFKQGSRFDGWRDGSPGDAYLHPFTAPPPEPIEDLLAAWRAAAPDASFADAMTAQSSTCARDLAPRLRAMPDYAGALNYGYHLDAGKFAALLAHHGTTRLGIAHRIARVARVEDDADGLIARLHLSDGTVCEGDLFLDCSGQAALLIHGHYGVDWVDLSRLSLNDSALAVQVPSSPDCPIAAQTIGTAHEAGWIWDIALPHRRGVGCVFSSRFMDEEGALGVLSRYLGMDAASLTPRLLRFPTGHRAHFWHGNCIAIGQSAGFIEPLEASAIVMVELSARALVERFPASRAALPLLAARFNDLFTYRWERIVEFLKLHYALSQRTEPYWLAQRAPETIPPRLAQNLALWAHHAPSQRDFPQMEEVFSAASQHYVLYGMGFAPPAHLPAPSPMALRRMEEVRQRARAAAADLPTNRAYFTAMTGATAQP